LRFLEHQAYIVVNEPPNTEKNFKICYFYYQHLPSGERLQLWTGSPVKGMRANTGAVLRADWFVYTGAEGAEGARKGLFRAFGCQFAGWFLCEVIRVPCPGPL
jgi:hypothetical protein